jgi:hypothetical protein
MPSTVTNLTLGRCIGEEDLSGLFGWLGGGALPELQFLDLHGSLVGQAPGKLADMLGSGALGELQWLCLEGLEPEDPAVGLIVESLRGCPELTTFTLRHERGFKPAVFFRVMSLIQEGHLPAYRNPPFTDLTIEWTDEALEAALDMFFEAYERGQFERSHRIKLVEGSALSEYAFQRLFTKLPHDRDHVGQELVEAAC